MVAIRSAKLSRYLEQCPSYVLTWYCVVVAFTTYFCMYAFRKPFTAATYDGLYLFGSHIELKTAFVVSQILGYALSKVAGIRICTEVSRASRAWMLVVAIAIAELALVLFAIVPTSWKVAAIFLDGLPLGIVWGLVVWYLEGRRTSDFLLAALCCSFIVSSGVVKDIGRALMAGGALPVWGLQLPNPFPAVDQFWMPAATGMLFLPVFLGAVWLLDQIPDPTAADVAARTLRQPMNLQRRRQFLVQFLPGVLMLLGAYFFLTAFRDFRDNYFVEVLDQLGYKGARYKDIISRMELFVALGVMSILALPILIKDNRVGVMAIFGAMTAGLWLMGVATYFLNSGIITGFWWMILIGLGSYLAYVPFNAVLFDRLIASTGFVGTAVFAIYLADSLGYAGSVVIQIGKDALIGETSRLEFLKAFSYFMSLFGSVSCIGACVYFLRKSSSVHTSARLSAVLTAEVN